MHITLVVSVSCLRQFWSISVGAYCGEPDVPTNGRVDTSAGTSFRDVARYSCNTGYTMNGPAERSCLADGQWSGSVPTCESEMWEHNHSMQLLLHAPARQ